MTATFWTAAYLPHRQLRNETEVSQIVDIDLICRIGSLEIDLLLGKSFFRPYLPHRQLRKIMYSTVSVP